MRLSTNSTGKSLSTCPLSLLVLGLVASASVVQAAPVSWNETALSPVAAASRVLGGLMPAQTQVGGVAVPLFQGRKQGVGITNDDGYVLAGTALLSGRRVADRSSLFVVLGLRTSTRCSGRRS